MARAPEKPGPGLKELQVKALREARFERRKMSRFSHEVTPSDLATENELLRAEVKRLKRLLAKANKHG